MSKQNAVMSEFYCTQCGTKGLPIWRRAGKEREAGHLKKLYCLKCQKETNHVECKENTHYQYEDFKLEYEYGNFSEEGLRKQKYGELRSDINDGKAEKVKTLGDGRSTWIGQEPLDQDS